MIHRKLFLATPSTTAKIYSSVVLSKLDYCGAVWDPHWSTLINELETLQKFVGKVVCKDWKASYSSLLKQHIHLPHSPLTPHPHPGHPNNRILLMSLTKTNSHHLSFFVDVVPHWNSLPFPIIDSPSHTTFKCRLCEHVHISGS